jgi:hypothetical protein
MTGPKPDDEGDGRPSYGYEEAKPPPHIVWSGLKDQVRVIHLEKVFSQKSIH